jgi:hypothetical protein
MESQNTPARVFGPYETERDTHGEPLVRRVTQSETTNMQHLLEACAAADVDLGAFDISIIMWLSRWEPATVQVVIGLISRAYAAGVKAGEAR